MEDNYLSWKLQEVIEECKDLSWGQFKPLLTDALISHLEPIQKRYTEIVADAAYIDKILADGRQRANEIAQGTLNNAYQAMGFLHGRPVL
ncbi:hypothetical protein KP509_1Z265900 [Ceratopteris richardii]|nr:hypothetical protein KP509_1Z265900 [Ceratopteris richardii]